MIERLRSHPGSSVALFEPERGGTLTYAELSEMVELRGERLRAAAGGRALVFLAMTPDLESIVLYLACLAADLPLCLAEPQPEPLARLTQAYQPALLLLPQGLAAPPGYRRDAAAPNAGGIGWWRAETERPIALHPDLALLLTTSGSTGSPKLVRLARRNLEANALSIAEYLDLGPGERAIQSLPTHYSYGLSVLNSHLLAGGAVVLTPHSFMRPEFWKVVDELGCTSFAGVPYMYETLHRLRFAPGRHRSLRTMTQAGGGLRPDLIAHFHEQTAPGVRFFVMYGQTEATARISYVPPQRLGEKIGSIGIPIPGGALRLAPVEGGEGQEELVYEGPNVMLGYAERPADLVLGDVQRGVLVTGDLGRVDGDGFFYVSGRLKRFAKLFGRRVSLEDVERELEARFPVRAAALESGERLVIHTVIQGDVTAEQLATHIARHLSVPPVAIEIRLEEALPMTAAGKKDYKTLGAPETRRA